MTDVAKLQIQVDSQPALTAAQNLAALDKAAARVVAQAKNLRDAKLGKSASDGGANFKNLSTPVNAAADSLVEFSNKLVTSAENVNRVKSDIGNVGTSFEKLEQAVRGLGQRDGIKAFREVAKAISDFGKTAGNVLPKVRALTAEVRALRDASGGVARTMGSISKSIGTLGKNVGNANPEMTRLARLVGNAGTRMDSLRQATGQVNTELNRMEKASSGAAKGGKQVERQVRATGLATLRASNFVRQFATGLGLVSGGFALATGIREFVGAIRDFELQAAKTAAVTIRMGTAFDVAAQQQQALINQARDLGAATRFTAVEAAEAQFFLARAGFEANEVIAATPATLDLAAAGYIDLGRAADIASNVLQQFNLQTTELSDVGDALVFTANNANTSVEQMAQALAYAGPFASSLGVSVNEATAAIGALGNAGIQGSLAGTNFRGILVSLLSPSREAGEELDKLGARLANFGDRSAFDVAALGIEQVLINLRESTEAAGDASQSLAKVFNRRNVSGALALSKNVEDFSELLSGLGNDLGTAEQVAEFVDDTLAGALLRARSAATELSLAIGDKGVGASLRDFVDNFAAGLRVLAGAEPLLQDNATAAQTMADRIERAGAVIAGVLAGGAMAAAVATGLAFKDTLTAIGRRLVINTGRMLGSTRAQTAYNKAVAAGTIGNKAFAASLRTVGLSNPLFAIGSLVSTLAILGSEFFGLTDNTRESVEAQRLHAEATEENRRRMEQAGKTAGTYTDAIVRLSNIGNLFAQGDVGAAAGQLGEFASSLDATIKGIESAGGQSILQLSLEDAAALSTAVDEINDKLLELGTPEALSLTGPLREAFNALTPEALRTASPFGETPTAAISRRIEPRFFRLGAQNLPGTGEFDVEDSSRLLRENAEELRQLAGDQLKEALKLKLGVDTLTDAQSGAVREQVDRLFRDQQDNAELLNEVRAQQALIENKQTREVGELNKGLIARVALERGVARAAGSPGAIDLEIIEANNEAFKERLRIVKDLASAVRSLFSAQAAEDERAKNANTIAADVARATGKAQDDIVADLKAQIALKRELLGQDAEGQQRVKQEAALRAKIAEAREGAKGEAVEREKISEEAQNLLDTLFDLDRQDRIRTETLKEQEKISRLVARNAARVSDEQFAATELERELGLIESITQQEAIRNRVLRETQKIKLDEDTTGLTPEQLEDRLKRRNKLEKDLTEIFTNQAKAAERTAALRAILDLQGRRDKSAVGLDTGEQTIAQQTNAFLDALNVTPQTEGFEQLRETVRGLFQDIRDNEEQAAANAVQADLDALNAEIELKKKQVEQGGKLTAQQRALARATEEGREADLQYVESLRLAITEIDVLDAALAKLNESTKNQGTLFSEFSVTFREGTEDILRQAGALQELTVAQEAERLIRDQSIILADGELEKLEELIAKRREATQLLEEKTEADRRAQQIEQQVQQQQQQLAGSLADVALGAKSAEEAMLGFVNQLLKAIVQAQIFKALGPLFGNAGGFGPIGSLIAAGGGVPSYKGNVFSGGSVDNRYYYGGIPSLDQLPKVGSIPQAFRGSDGSLNTLREGGSSEAILPLGRDGSGRLGVRMIGGDARGNTSVSTTNNTTVQNFNMSMPEDTFSMTDRQRRRAAGRATKRR